MHDQPNKPRLRLPEKLAFTAFRVAIAGTVACSGAVGDASSSADAAADAVADAPVDAPADGTMDGSTDASPSDAAEDVAVLDGADDGAADGSAGDACASSGEPIFCGPAMPDASCPGNVCDISQCPLDAGCEPFV